VNDGFFFWFGVPQTGYRGNPSCACYMALWLTIAQKTVCGFLRFWLKSTWSRHFRMWAAFSRWLLIFRAWWDEYGCPPCVNQFKMSMAGFCSELACVPQFSGFPSIINAKKLTLRLVASLIHSSLAVQAVCTWLRVVSAAW